MTPEVTDRISSNRPDGVKDSFSIIVNKRIKSIMFIYKMVWKIKVTLNSETKDAKVVLPF